MGITFVPAAGDVLSCDFGPNPANIVAPGVMHGPLAVPPEIYKPGRPVAVLSSLNGMSIIVPFSTSQPRNVVPYHLHIPAGAYPFLSQVEDSWLKADLIETVSPLRLDRMRLQGRFQRVQITAAHLRDLRAAVLHAVQLGRLVQHL